MMTHAVSLVGRRGLLGLVSTAFVLSTPWRLAVAETTDDASARVPVERLNDALLVAMRVGSRTPFNERYSALTPVIEQVFKLDAVLASSIGLYWVTVPETQEDDI